MSLTIGPAAQDPFRPLNWLTDLLALGQVTFDYHSIIAAAARAAVTEAKRQASASATPLDDVLVKIIDRLVESLVVREVGSSVPVLAEAEWSTMSATQRVAWVRDRLAERGIALPANPLIIAIIASSAFRVVAILLELLIRG